MSIEKKLHKIVASWILITAILISIESFAAFSVITQYSSFYLLILLLPLIFSLIVSYGLFKNRKWGWVLVVVPSLLSLFGIKLVFTLFSQFSLLRQIWIVINLLANFVILVIGITKIFNKSNSK